MLEQQSLKFFRSLLAHVSLASKDYVTAMPRSLFALLLFTLLPFTTQAVSFAQDDAYIGALSTVYGVGISAVFSHEWCDARAPELQTFSAQAFETWQAQHSFLAIEDAIRTLMGGSFSALEETFAEGRTEAFALFDDYVSDPAGTCQNLLAELNDNYNLRQDFPNEYALIDANLGASQTAETTNSLTETTTPDTTNTANPLSAGSENPLTNTAPTEESSSTQPSAETLTLTSGEVLTAGGVLEPGDYNCISEFYYAYDNTTRTREYLLSFYPDMGLRITEEDDEEDYTFVYNYATGELDTEGDGFNIDNNLTNYDAYDYDVSIWFKFYRDAQNQPVLYGENIQDTTSEDIVTTLCRYAGASQRPSPAEERAAEIEAERFKYVTAPGQGLQLADIEGFLVNPADAGIDGFLLLKDGSAYKNLQVPPADLDVAASKQYESENWGVWQRSGGNITIQWNDSSDLATFSDGADYFFDPAGSGERLNDTFSSVSGASSGNIGFGGVVITDYASFIFSPDGHFDSTNYTTAGSTNTIGELSTSSGYYADAEGTVGGSSASNTIGDVSSGIATSVETTNPNPAPATTGTYSLDGFTLELRYDDGRVERHFIYFYGAAKDSMNISGRYYSTE
jgi:hypothetical protein